MTIITPKRLRLAPLYRRGPFPPTDSAPPRVSTRDTSHNPSPPTEEKERNRKESVIEAPRYIGFYGWIDSMDLRAFGYVTTGLGHGYRFSDTEGKKELWNTTRSQEENVDDKQDPNVTDRLRGFRTSMPQQWQNEQISEGFGPDE